MAALAVVVWGSGGGASCADERLPPTAAGPASLPARSTIRVVEPPALEPPTNSAAAMVSEAPVPEGPVHQEYQDAPESWPGGQPASAAWPAIPYGMPSHPCEPDLWGPLEWCLPERSFVPVMTWLGFHHSYVDGRNVERGWPLTGTSWLNRPYFFGGQLGALWMTERVEDSVGRDTDVFGGLLVGWDFDHYWGYESRVDRATPELINSNQPNAQREDRLMLWSFNLMYYPWGDALWRPYGRFGIGVTEIDFPTDAGIRRDESLLTFPLALGVKYPLRRWLAARVELADNLAAGKNGVPTLHNVALTFGFECRYGAHPPSYWPWNPSPSIW